VSVEFRDGTIVLAGDCPVASGETLLSQLLTHPDAIVDMTNAGSVHTALWQILIVCAPRIVPPATEGIATKYILERIGARGSWL
jgi:hypothetical protein